MNSISALKILLSRLGKLETECYSDYFKRIAEILMNKCAISKRNVIYEIIEIEFYLFTSDHQDVITYPRKLSAGQWFFHQSGVDLTFESNTEHFGGILIRGLRRLSEPQKLILGPLNCVEELWNNLNAFEIIPSEYPQIIAWQFNDSQELIEYKRHIPLYGRDPYIKISEWVERLKKKNIQPSVSTENLSGMVFNSPYHFIKKGSINPEDANWKKYSAKPMG